MCECVEWQRRSPRVLVYSSAGVSVSVCARCLTALVRDSSSECTPCVQKGACLFAKSEGEKGKGKEEGEEECCSV